MDEVITEVQMKSQRRTESDTHIRMMGNMGGN